MSARLVVIATILTLLAAPQAKSDSRAGGFDMDGFLTAAHEAAALRESRRLSEDAFIRMSREPGTVILDARSAERYAELHVEGAVNLSFPDIAIDTLVRAIPDRNTRILIYCNNNFRDAESAFPSKLPSASLNLSTFIALYDYGYRNVWELEPVVDIDKSKLTFVGTGSATIQSPVAREGGRALREPF